MESKNTESRFLTLYDGLSALHWQSTLSEHERVKTRIVSKVTVILGFSMTAKANPMNASHLLVSLHVYLYIILFFI